MIQWKPTVSCKRYTCSLGLLLFTFLATFILENRKVPLITTDEQNHAWVKDGVKDTINTSLTLGWSSVHWNATGWPSVHWDTTGPSSEYLQGTLEHHCKNSPTLECHWRNLVETAPHWDATGETLTFAAYIETPLEGLWQPTHAPTHIVKHAE